LSKSLKVLEEKKQQEVRAITSQSETLENEAKVVSEIAKQLDLASLNFDECLEQRKVKVDTFLHNTKDLKSFEAKHKKGRDKIRELEFQKANTVEEANGLEGKKSQTKAKIPKLEVEQKAMAGAKNFKGAAMKKTEIKEAQ
jgi:chromosome segregation ATPase